MMNTVDRQASDVLLSPTGIIAHYSMLMRINNKIIKELVDSLIIGIAKTRK